MSYLTSPMARKKECKRLALLLATVSTDVCAHLAEIV